MTMMTIRELVEGVMAIHDLYPTHGTCPRLTYEEEIKLSGMIHAGDSAALDKLVRANLPLVISLVSRMPAWKHVHSGLNREDLIQEGNLHLVRAAKEWEPRGTRFATFARSVITRWVQRTVEKQSRTIYIPTNLQEKNRKMEARQAAMTAQNRVAPTESELATSLGWSSKDVRDLKSTFTREPIPIDWLIRDKP